MSVTVTTAEEGSGSTTPAIRRWRTERIFYSGMAIAALLTVFVGFAPTYYLKAQFGTPELPPLRHFHGALFTAWILLFVVQTTLIAARRTPVHRRLGVAGGILAATMVVVGAVTAIDAAGRGAAPTGVPPLAFLAIPLADMTTFGLLIGAALYYRRRTDTHKRLMLLATISLLTAAIARLPFAFILAYGPPAFFGLTDLFIVACVAYDLVSRGRVHPATLWGGLLLVVSQPLRLVISGTSVWLAFAAWLVG